MLRYKSIAVLLTTVSVLFACSNSKFVEEGEKNVNAGNAEVKEREKQLKELEEKQKKIYEDMEKPLDEVIQENELDSKELMEDTTVAIKASYEDENEFGKLVGQVLYNFHNQTISTEDYYNFMNQYASKNAKGEMAKNKEDQIMVYDNIQTIFKNQKIKREAYSLSKVTLTESHKEGYFYRKVTTDKGDEYFITTIVNEDGVWKFDQDHPSPPFIIEDVMLEEKGE